MKIGPYYKYSIDYNPYYCSSKNWTFYINTFDLTFLYHSYKRNAYLFHKKIYLICA